MLCKTLHVAWSWPLGPHRATLHPIQPAAITLRHFRALERPCRVQCSPKTHSHTSTHQPVTQEYLAAQWHQQLKEMHGASAAFRCDVARFASIVAAIDARAPHMAALTDQALAGQTRILRDRVAAGASLDDVLVDAFAVVREAATRVLGQRPYLVQLFGGIVLHEGRIAEMATGEGKTLVATLPAYLHALTGKGVHVLTTNDYLARRDAQSMGRLFSFLGMTVGFLPDVAQEDVTVEQRQAAVDADITYTTAETVAFTFLEDMFLWRAAPDVILRRPLAHAIIDEADSILIDKSVEPHILSRPAEGGGHDPVRYAIASMIAKDLRVDMQQHDSATILDALTILNKAFLQLFDPPAARAAEVDAHAKVDGGRGVDAVVYRQAGYARLTKEGAGRVVQQLQQLGMLDQPSVPPPPTYITSPTPTPPPGALLWHGGPGAWGPYITSALVAHHLLESKVDYIVDGDSVVLLDRATGRVKPRSRLQAMLHQSLEAKHGITPQPLSSTHASVSLQALGTAIPAAPELDTLYNLSIVRIPPNKPLARQDTPLTMFRSFPVKLKWLLMTLQGALARGQPVLLGTSSVTESELLVYYLSAPMQLGEEGEEGGGGGMWQGVTPRVLNATPELARQEARVVAQAGMPGSVTVSTNMAGRGTDILLGGSPKWCTLMMMENLMMPGLLGHESKTAWQPNNMPGAGIFHTPAMLLHATPQQLLQGLLVGPHPVAPGVSMQWAEGLLEEVVRCYKTAQQLARQVAETKAHAKAPLSTDHPEQALAFQVAIAKGEVGLSLSDAQALIGNAVDVAEGRYAAMCRDHMYRDHMYRDHIQGTIEKGEGTSEKREGSNDKGEGSSGYQPWSISTLRGLLARHGQRPPGNSQHGQTMVNMVDSANTYGTSGGGLDSGGGLERTWEGLLERQLLQLALLLWCWFDYACRLWKAQVVAAGGLLVIGTSVQDNERIERQLRGRAGRQGEPGSSCVVVDLQDPRMQPIPPLLLGMEASTPTEEDTILPGVDMGPLLMASGVGLRQTAEREQRAALSELDQMVDRFRRHICVILSAIRTGPPSDRRRLIMQAAQGTANILVTQFCNPSTPPDTWAWDALESNFLSCVLTDELTGEFTSLTPIQAAVRESLTGGGSRGLQLDADRGAPFGVPRQCVIEALCAGRPVPVAVEPEGRVWMHMCPWYTPTIRNQELHTLYTPDHTAAALLGDACAHTTSTVQQGRYGKAVQELQRVLSWLLLVHLDNAVAAVVHARTREWRQRMMEDSDYHPRADFLIDDPPSIPNNNNTAGDPSGITATTTTTSNANNNNTTASPGVIVIEEYEHQAARGMQEALQAAMYTQVVNSWSAFAEELEELKMRTNFVAFTFTDPRTEFQWEASRLFDTLIQQLPMAMMQACQHMAVLELTRAVEATGKVVVHPGVGGGRRWGEAQRGAHGQGVGHGQQGMAQGQPSQGVGGKATEHHVEGLHGKRDGGDGMGEDQGAGLWGEQPTAV